MQMIELDDGQVSLELAPSEVDAALDRLRGLGVVTLQPAATYNLVRVGDTRLVLQDEWDEPCLLSLDPAGAAILRSVADGSPSQRSAPL